MIDFIARSEWYPPVDISVSPVIHGAPMTYQDKLYVFGGAYDSGGSKQTNDVVIYDISRFINKLSYETDILNHE